MSSAATFRNGYTAMERFFLNPDAPFELVAADFGMDHMPMSTFWMVSYAPLAIMTGSTSSDDKVYNLTQESHGALFAGRSGSNVTTADVVTNEVVLKIHKAWAAGLIIISTILILAGIS
ncbi:hypothetical protein Q7P35_001471 [Cladosporium inversicolor]